MLNWTQLKYYKELKENSQYENNNNPFQDKEKIKTIILQIRNFSKNESLISLPKGMTIIRNSITIEMTNMTNKKAKADLNVK